MKASMSILILVGLMLPHGLNPNSYATPQGGKHILLRSAQLGKVRGASLRADIYIDMFDETIGDLRAKFSSGRAARTLRKDFVWGRTFRKDARFMVEDFTARGRPQVFLFAEHGGAGSCILDWDGKKLRKIYESGGGRTRTYPKKNNRGKWVLEEIWAPQQYFQGWTLPNGKRYSGGYVRRMMAWNGKRYVQSSVDISHVGIRRN